MKNSRIIVFFFLLFVADGALPVRSQQREPSVNYNTGSNNNHYHATPNVFDVQASAPQNASGHNTQDKPSLSDRDLINIGIVQAIIFGFQLVVFCIQSKSMRDTVKEMQKATEAASEALRITQRAFVSLENIDINFYSHRHTQDHTAYVQVTWSNSGTTPTRDMSYVISHKVFIEGEMPVDFGFPDINANGDVIVFGEFAVPIVLGPTSRCPISVPIDRETVRKAYEPWRRNHLYVWGRARYGDIFSDVIHMSEFCYELIFVGHPRTAERDKEQGLIRMIPWIAHNGEHSTKQNHA